MFPKNKVNQEQLKSLEKRVDRVESRLELKIEKTKNEMIMWNVGSTLALGALIITYLTLARPQTSERPEIQYIQNQNIYQQLQTIETNQYSKK